MKHSIATRTLAALLVAAGLYAPWAQWPAKAMTMAMRLRPPTAMVPSASPMAVCFCQSPRSASWACAPW